MAHECPECGLTCYCGGDIDDCCFHGTEEEMYCSHCDCAECGNPPDFCECEPEYYDEDPIVDYETT